jgi:hypothetical protein
MGLYEVRQKVARELSEKLASKVELSTKGVDKLIAQIVVTYGLPKRSAKELIDAHIELGNIKVYEIEKD